MIPKHVAANGGTRNPTPSGPGSKGLSSMGLPERCGGMNELPTTKLL